MDEKLDYYIVQIRLEMINELGIDPLEGIESREIDYVQARNIYIRVINHFIPLKSTHLINKLCVVLNMTRSNFLLLLQKIKNNNKQTKYCIDKANLLVSILEFKWGIKKNYITVHESLIEYRNNLQIELNKVNKLIESTS